MQRIPVIAGLGGINAAGRTSGHHAYRRTVVDALDASRAETTWRSLAALVGQKGPVDDAARQRLAENSLVRSIAGGPFDPDRAPWNRSVQLTSPNGPIHFEIKSRNLPEHLPAGWRVADDDGKRATIEIAEDCELFVPDLRSIGVGAGGMVPTGFDPEALYRSRSHPRGLQLTIFAASDALGSLGLDWEAVRQRISPSELSTYAGSAIAQMDDNGFGGLLGYRYRGKRITSKHLAMGLSEMPADFTNAYVLGSLGQTGHNVGACATFLYNLRMGVDDIRAGRARIAVVGGVDTPLQADVMDGLATMGALATDASLRDLDGQAADETPDHRRACRPFGANSGFVVGEGAQFLVLMDDELALELGAHVYGGVGEVFAHADGHKKSITSPGIGNHVTFARAVASAGRALGDEAVRRRSFVHAHGTGTPQNRVTESEILDAVARAFGIEAWPVAAIKCFVGHTMAGAGGDQIASALGTWVDGVIPGVTTIDSVADDVAAERLNISSRHQRREPGSLDVAFVNSKGFGGNNATAWITAPHVVEGQLEAAHGARAVTEWRHRAEATRERAADHDRRAIEEGARVIYRFDHDVRDNRHVKITRDRVEVEGYPPIEL